MKMRMGATHFLTKTLPKIATEMALDQPAEIAHRADYQPIRAVTSAILGFR